MSTNSDQKDETTRSLSPTQVSSSKTKIIKERIINSVNELLKTCKSDPNQSISSISIPNEISSIKQIKSNIFVYFYEQICSTELIDKKWPCKNQEDEIHNLQSVIDSLSLDVLHEDLSHLTAESILGLGSNNRRDLKSLEYLLDILKTTQEWITSRLENSENYEPILSLEENNTNQNHELVNQNNFNEKYSQVERKMEETIKLTQEAIKENSIKYKQDNNVNDDCDDNDDIFKKYMQQKELEFKLKKCSNLIVSDRETLKSSSGNSSLNDALNSSIDSSSMNEMFNLAINLNNQQLKQVKFQIDSRTRSHSPEIRYNKENNISRSSRRKIANYKSPTIQTRHNEIEMIKNSLAQSLDLNSDKIERLMNLIYSEDYEDAQAMMLNSLKSIKKKSDLTNDLYLNAHEGTKLFKSKLIPSERSRSKGVLLPRSKSLVKINKKRSSSLNNNLNKNDPCKKRWHSAVKKSLELSKDPAKKFYSRYVIGEDGILSSLLEEFPYLYTSPETIHYLWSRHAKQIETLSKTQKDLDAKYLSKNSADNLAENYLKEANRKQEILMNIMRKELEHIERQQDMKRKNLVENSLKAKTREQRFQTAKVKRYFEEFRIQHKAKMLKQKTSEELIFKKLFNETLKIQKERMLELKKYAKEKNEINLKQQINQIKSIENFYKNKFDLLNEHIKKEKEETELRDNSQHLILNKMKNQVKHKLETDIRDLQDQMYRDKDFLHWRQLDADRLKQDIAKASYFRPVVSLNSFNN